MTDHGTIRTNGTGETGETGETDETDETDDGYTRRGVLATGLGAAAGSLLVNGAAAGPARAATRGNPLTLWYTRPAAQCLEALPVGCGRLGAMVFGGVETERLQLNEDGIWAAGRTTTTTPRRWPPSRRSGSGSGWTSGRPRRTWPTRSSSAGPASRRRTRCWART
ncbi:glycoside hydrolase N-terminal domain-containing protein [Nonomuraea fuscirosea]|uniref:glycoside hydrolase N-terminal domain-containing protein n=1 Tax=Nonomuraea fuscirosea TaxID=1291556 RepID=UPI0033C77769